MQPVIKYDSKRRISLGWTIGGAVMAVLATTIGITLVLTNHRVSRVAPSMPLAKEQSLPVARVRTLADVIGSEHYPFGASGFDSLLPSKPAPTRAELVGSGHYPFGASGFDSLLPDTH